MAAKKIPLKEASEAELRAFAQAHLGMEFDASARLASIRAQVATAWGKDEIVLALSDTADDLTPAGVAPARVGAAPVPSGAVRIIIQRSDEVGGDEAVPVGVNGRVMLIPRGEPVTIPLAYFEVLQNAVTHRYESLRDGGLNPVPRAVPMYPFQRLP